MSKIIKQTKKGPNPSVEFNQVDAISSNDSHLTFSKMIHSFIKENKDGEGCVQNMRDLAARMGINYESFRKMVNRRRPVKERDFIIGVAAVLGMDSLLASDAIQAYDGCMGTFDLDINKRDILIADRLDNHPGENTIDSLNALLRMNGFHELSIPGKKQETIQYPYKMLKSGVTSVCEFTYQADPYDSLDMEYLPQNYRVYAWMFLDAGDWGYRLTVDDTDCSAERYPALDGKMFKNYKDPEDSGEFKECFELLQGMKDREVRRLCGYLLDTRNYQGRYSAEFKNGGLHVYYEKYNYTIPELNEYYMMEYIDGKFQFSVSHASRFMFLRLDEQDCRKYFGRKDPGIAEVYSSEEEIQAAFRDKKEYHGPDYIRLRRSAYRSMRKKVEEIARDLRDRKQFIRHLEYIWDDSDRVCQYYGVDKEYQCWLDECEMIAGADSAVFSDSDGNNVTVTLPELKRAFELGYNSIREICDSKTKRGNVENIFLGV